MDETKSDYKCLTEAEREQSLDKDFKDVVEECFEDQVEQFIEDNIISDTDISKIDSIISGDTYYISNEKQTVSTESTLLDNNIETVLCFDGRLLYEAVCVKQGNNCDKTENYYYIHWVGLDNLWDEWIHKSLVMSMTYENIKPHIDLIGQPLEDSLKTRFPLIDYKVNSTSTINKFKINERILCFYHSLFFEAKIIDITHQNKYLIHYDGFSNQRDRWVKENRLLKITDKNIESHRGLIARLIIRGSGYKNFLSELNGVIEHTADVSCLQTGISENNNVEFELIDDKREQKKEGSALNDTTLKLKIDNISQMSDIVCGESFPFKSMTWSIMAMPTYNRQTADQQPLKDLGFFLICNIGDRRQGWWCEANAELVLIAQKPGASNFVQRFTHKFSWQENDWGYNCFISWDELMSDECGYVSEDAIILEVHLSVVSSSGDNRPINLFLSKLKQNKEQVTNNSCPQSGILENNSGLLCNSRNDPNYYDRNDIKHDSNNDLNINGRISCKSDQNLFNDCKIENNYSSPIADKDYKEKYIRQLEDTNNCLKQLIDAKQQINKFSIVEPNCCVHNNKDGFSFKMKPYFYRIMLALTLILTFFYYTVY